MPIKFSIKDKDHVDTESKSYDKLVLEAGASGYIDVKSPREFSLTSVVIGPGLRDYKVKIEFNINGKDTFVPALLKEEAKLSTQEEVFQYVLEALYFALRYQVRINIKNDSLNEETYYFQINAFEGAEIPHRKF